MRSLGQGPAAPPSSPPLPSAKAVGRACPPGVAVLSSAWAQVWPPSHGRARQRGGACGASARLASLGCGPGAPHTQPHDYPSELPLLGDWGALHTRSSRGSQQPAQGHPPPGVLGDPTLAPARLAVGPGKTRVKGLRRPGTDHPPLLQREQLASGHQLWGSPKVGFLCWPWDLGTPSPESSLTSSTVPTAHSGAPLAGLAQLRLARQGQQSWRDPGGMRVSRGQGKATMGRQTWALYHGLCVYLDPGPTCASGPPWHGVPPTSRSAGTTLPVTQGSSPGARQARLPPQLQQRVGTSVSPASSGLGTTAWVPGGPQGHAQESVAPRAGSRQGEWPEHPRSGWHRELRVLPTPRHPEWAAALHFPTAGFK